MKKTRAVKACIADWSLRSTTAAARFAFGDWTMVRQAMNFPEEDC